MVANAVYMTVCIPGSLIIEWFEKRAYSMEESQKTAQGVMKASTITSSPSASAKAIAGRKASAVFTLVVPKLLPPLAGYTKQGRPMRRMMSSSDTSPSCP